MTIIYFILSVLAACFLLPIITVLTVKWAFFLFQWLE